MRRHATCRPEPRDRAPRARSGTRCARRRLRLGGDTGGRLVLAGGRGRGRQDRAPAPLLRAPSDGGADPVGRLRRALHAVSARSAGRHRRRHRRRARGRSSPTAAPPHAVAAALLRRAGPARPGDRRLRGRALGRRGDARRPAPARPAHRDRPGAPRSRATATTSSTAPIPLRVTLGELSRLRRRPTGSGSPRSPVEAVAELARATRRRCRRAVSPDGREPVLRDRGARRGRPSSCPPRSATPCSPASRR